MNKIQVRMNAMAGRGFSSGKGSGASLAFGEIRCGKRMSKDHDSTRLIHY
jgi:hypothetical protein